MTLRAALVLSALLCLMPREAPAGPAEAAGAEDSAFATIGLRGGYDSNPANLPGGSGSAFLTQSATFEMLRGTDKDGFAVSAAATNTLYEAPEVAPAGVNLLSFRHAVSLGGDTLLRSSLAVSGEQSWSRRQAAAHWRERLDRDIGPWRLFASLDLRYVSLNERNIFTLGQFLPDAESFVTFSALPGASYRLGEGEVGASLLAARTAYRFPTDYLGLKRDNDRLQANVFASGTLAGLRLEGSLSLARIVFPSRDFQDRHLLLYTAKATVPLAALRLPAERVSLELSSARTLEDTTLPFAVINRVTLHEAKLLAKLDERRTLGLFASHRTSDYLGLGASAVLASLGAEYAHALGGGTTALASATLRRTVETGHPPLTSFNVQVGLTRRVDWGRPAGAAPPR